MPEWDFFSSPDALSVTLECPVRPFSTNGKYNARGRKVIWDEFSIDEKDIPARICFALWSEPEKKFQKKHFGRTVLNEQRLAAYIIWREGLDAKDATEWDEFLSSLSPGKDLESTIKSFLFASEPTEPDKDRPPSLADHPIYLLLQGLETTGKTKRIRR